MENKKIIRVSVAQLNLTVGDLNGNTEKIIESIKKAENLNSDVIIFPELSITGYPPEDLLLKSKFIQDNLKKLEEIKKEVNNIIAIVGFVDKVENNLYNSAAIIYNKKIYGIYHKIFLPNYSVFDEKRYFKSGNEILIFNFDKIIFSVEICEDIWHFNGPIKEASQNGAKIIFINNASPYYLGKIKEREEIIISQAKKNNLFIVYTNLVGGQDEIVFDGQSRIVDNLGNIIAGADAFKEEILNADLNIPESEIKLKNIIEIPKKIVPKTQIISKKPELLKPEEEVYKALILGLKDYILKNGFQKVVIGLSGGIDSSLVATLAVDTLGNENVIGVFMPSRYTSKESEEDVEELVKNLKIRLIKISIEPIYEVYLKILKPHFLDKKEDITEENLQARIRGNILMALSNKFGWLVLATGNKSEMSTGYATLYGDMAGGFAVLKDVPKTLVYKLANYRNSIGYVIPQRVLVKAPTAELKFNQKDSDTLPEYELLDSILKLYIEEDKEFEEIVGKGFDAEIVKKVLNMVDKSEYKRRQAPPGIKITPKAFGKDRRMPITNKYRG